MATAMMAVTDSDTDTTYTASVVIATEMAMATTMAKYTDMGTGVDVAL